MPARERLTATVSTKGQVVLPKAIRRTLGWEAGTRLVVEEAPGGVLLKPAAAFPATRPEDVFGCLPADRPRSVAEMEAGVLAEAKRRHEGG
ncbi:MAG: AbrB/MazE/SpoVT family DNA-binding domain-containing protein [Alphaproteobacteria bacterium]|nr:AbrB/MazE/SpoVT family DNA-binding domain-containing protein [Alphaproteobacteria bacterium]